MTQNVLYLVFGKISAHLSFESGNFWPFGLFWPQKLKKLQKIAKKKAAKVAASWVQDGSRAGFAVMGGPPCTKLDLIRAGPPQASHVRKGWDGARVPHTLTIERPPPMNI